MIFVNNLDVSGFIYFIVVFYYAFTVHVLLQIRSGSSFIFGSKRTSNHVNILLLYLLGYYELN